VGSTVPASFFARTSSWWTPGRRSWSRYGLSHDPNVPSSSAHSNAASGSFEEKVKVADVFTVVAGGPESMVVSGAETVHR
jgi:hypothetical protein